MVRRVPDFTQRESRIQVTNLTHGLTNFTLEMWVACPRRAGKSTTGIMTYRANAQAHSEWYGLFLEITRKPDQARVRFVLGNGDTIKVDVHTTFQNYATWSRVWRQLAVAYDGTKAVIYMDGAAAATTATTGGATLIPRDRGISFGSYYSGNTRRRFKGRIAEVRLWNVLRTPSEIDKNRFCPLSKNESLDCLGYWPLDEGMGTIANDRTIPQNNGTLYDIAGWADWNDKISGTFMDDFENSLEVKEAGVAVADSSTSEWGADVARNTQRTLDIANTCQHCDLNINRISTNTGDFTIPALGNPIGLKPQGGLPNSLSTNITFSPRRSGARSSQVIVETDRPFYNPYQFRYEVQATYVEKATLEVYIDSQEAAQNQTTLLGTLPENDEKILIVKNAGAGTLDVQSVVLGTTSQYTLTPVDPNQTLPAHLGANQDLKYTLKFTPQGGDGTKTADITVTSSDPQDPFKFKVSAIYDAKPIMAVKLDGVDIGDGYTSDWGSVPGGTTKTLTITNTGRDSLNIRKITISPKGYFTLTPALAKGGRVDVAPASNNPRNLTLKFDAKGTTGQQNAVITINSDDPNTPQFILNVSATSSDNGRVQVKHLNQDMTNGGFVSWGSTDKDRSNPIEVGNLGKSSVQVTDVSVDTNEFEVSNRNLLPLTLAAESNGTIDLKQFDLKFTPDVSKGHHTVNANVTVTSNDPVHPKVTFQVQATYDAVGELVVLDGGTTVRNRGSLNWGKVASGTSRWFTLKNKGMGTLRINSVSLNPANGFSLSPTSTVTTLRPGGTARVRLTFKGGRGLMRARLNISSDDPNVSYFSFDINAEEPTQPKMQLRFLNTEPVVNGQTFNLGNISPPSGFNYITWLFNIRNIGSGDLKFTMTMTDMRGRFVFGWPGGPAPPPTEISDFTIPETAVGGFVPNILFFTDSGLSRVKINLTTNDPNNRNFSFYINCQGQGSGGSYGGGGNGGYGSGSSSSGTGQLELYDYTGRKLKANVSWFAPGTFPVARVGGPVTETFTLRNEGSGTITLNGQPKVVGGTPTEWTLGYINNLQIPPGGSVPMTVTLHPDFAGPKAAQIRFWWDDHNEWDYYINAEARF